MDPESTKPEKQPVSIRSALRVAAGFVFDAVLEKLQERRDRKEERRRRRPPPPPPDHW